MSQHDYVIANGTGAAVRSDLNNALAAIVSNNSGATEPATMYAYQWWADTSTGLLKLRNAANNAWITLRELDGTLTIEAGTVSAPGLAFASDLNTGIYSPSADQLAIATNGVERVEWGTSEVVFNDGGANYDFRIEGDTNSSLFFVDASAEAVGIGSTAPSQKLSVEDAADTYALIKRTTSGSESAILFGAESGKTVIYSRDNTTGGRALEFAIGTSPAARIDTSGRFLVGTSSARLIEPYGLGADGQSANTFESVGDTDPGPGLALCSNATTARLGPYLYFCRSGAATVGSNTVVTNGDNLGTISFAGADGTDVRTRGAAIYCEVDGTPGSNDMPGRLVFSTTADGASSPTERMRISNGGFASFNTTSIIGSSRVSIAQDFNAGNGLAIKNTGAQGGGQYFAVFYNSSDTLAGSIAHNGSATVAFNTSSDYRLKENVVLLTGAANRVNQLQVHRFNFIEEPDRVVDGFIAHEVQAVVPEAITGEKDAVDADGKPVYQGIDQSKLVPLLTAALQEAIGRIETLEAEVAALKAS